MRQTVYWVGNHCDQELSDAISRIVLENAVERGLGRAEVGRMLKAALGERFEQSDAYWKGLAAHAPYAVTLTAGSSAWQPPRGR